MREEAVLGERVGGKGRDWDEKKPTRCLKGMGLPVGCVCFQGGKGGGTAEQVIAVTTSPQRTASPPSFPLWGDLFFPLPCYIGLALLQTDKSGEGPVIKESLFFQLLCCACAKFRS